MTADPKFTLYDTSDVSEGDTELGPGWVLEGIDDYLDEDAPYVLDGDFPLSDDDAKTWAARLIQKAIDARVTGWQQDEGAYVPALRHRHHEVVLHEPGGARRHTGLTRGEVEYILRQLKDPDAVIELPYTVERPAENLVGSTVHYPVRHITRVLHRVTETTDG